MKRSKTKCGISRGVISVLLLTLCLAGITYAVSRIVVPMNNNHFSAGTVNIAIEDGKYTIIGETGETKVGENGFLLEPGMTIDKTVTVKNTGTAAFYYKVYLKDVSGGLKDVLQVTVLDGNTAICEGKPAELTKGEVSASGNALSVGSSKELTVRFYYPVEVGNNTQDQSLVFTVVAEATQMQNNDPQNPQF